MSFTCRIPGRKNVENQFPTGPQHGLSRRTVLKVGTAMATTMLFSRAVLAQQAGAPQVQTAHGPVVGETANGVHVFKGIRYGADTGGENRFQPPRAPEPWTEPLRAIATSTQFPQPGYPPFLMQEEGVDLDKGGQSEDSLFLNVWTAGLEEDTKRPVMVWFHGGGFTSGSGGSVRYDGTNLASRQDVVVVTVNHRLGVFGFLDLSSIGGEQYAQSGNVGMLDIVQALEWVRDNIAKFGGDPANVTVFGESGGGSKVTTLMGMPKAKGLFHRVIAQSGVAVTSIRAEAAAKTAEGVLSALGVGAGNIGDLAGKTTQEILSAGKGNFGPVVDGAVLPSNVFEPEASALSAGVPLLVGSNLTEVTFFNNTPTEPIDDAALTAAVVGFTKLDEAKANELIALYKNNNPDRENHMIYQLLGSDWWMGDAVNLTAERKAAQGGPVYVYLFAKPQMAQGGKLNVPHTSEIAFVFDNIALSQALVGADTPDMQAVADKVAAAWASFARDGKPSAKGMPEWPQYTAENPAVMVIDDNPAIEVDPFGKERDAIRALKAQG